MLDKETLLRGKDSFPDDEESLEDFLSCLERAKEITDYHKGFHSCVEKILESVDEEE